MSILSSHITTQSEEYQANLHHNRHLMGELNTVRERLSKGGAERDRQRHLSQGKMLARDRIEALLDSNSPFLEIGALAGGFDSYQVYDESTPAAGVVAGIGVVHGRLVMIVANDATVKGGAYFPLTVKKHLRAQEIAFENHLPCVYLVDSGGAYLPLQSEVFPDRDHFGRIFYNQARLSAAGIPQISAVMGSCTAGGAYVPAMCDQSVIVKGTGTIFLAGPPLVKAATGEDVTAEELGGAKVHTEKSGVADYYAENDSQAIGILRQILFYSGNREFPNFSFQNAREPLYDPSELLGIWPRDSRRQVDVREVIARLVDESRLLEFKPRFGTTLVTGFAHLHGMPCGIIANNGVLFSESALKGTHFIELCTRDRIPLVFLQNVTGFMVGAQYEQSGIAKDGAKLVHAVSTAGVPKITLLLGGSYGAGNYGMCGRAFSPRFLWTWPSSRISVMGGEQAAQVLLTVKDTQRLKLGHKPLNDAERDDLAGPIRSKYELEGHPFYATARLWDDGVVGFEETRQVLALSLAAALNPPSHGETRLGVLRM